MVQITAEYGSRVWATDPTLTGDIRWYTIMSTSAGTRPTKFLSIIGADAIVKPYRIQAVQDHTHAVVVARDTPSTLDKRSE